MNFRLTVEQVANLLLGNPMVWGYLQARTFFQELLSSLPKDLGIIINIGEPSIQRKFKDVRAHTYRRLAMTLTPFIRIPLIIVGSIAYRKAVTPPQPPPTPEENVVPTRLEYILRQPLGFWLTIIVWYITLAEIAVILASYYPDVLIAQRAMSIFVFETGTTENIRPTPIFFVGIFLTVIGSYIRWTCYRALGRMFTFELSVRKNHELVTDGPYAIVRHPAYTGLLLMLTGTFFWHGSSVSRTRGSWMRESGVLQTFGGKLGAFAYACTVSTVSMALLLRMSKEDLLMKKTFGKEWEEWASRVRFKLIPGVY